MIDIDIRLAVSDGVRGFELAASLRSDAPVIVLYGPSGAGKSLTLQAMAGLLTPDAGHVKIAGRTLFDSAAGIDVPAPRRGVGYLFQHYALFPHLSVRDNVAFGLRSWRRRRLPPAQWARVDGLLASLGLSALAHSRPATLSGGQQQRVALARALACEPSVLLLDEPFAALNPMLRGTLRRELADLRRSWNIPMVIITHDIDDVLALADQVFVYQDGRIVQEVDAHAGTSVERVREELVPTAPRYESATQRKVREMLERGAPG